MSRRWLVFFSTFLMISPAFAQFEAASLSRLDLLRRDVGSSPVVSPVFSQLFLYALPDEFKTLPEIRRKGYREQRAVPAAESAARWTQMITVAGDEAQAFGNAWPQALVDGTASRMKKNCPDAFSVLAIPNAFIASFDTAVGVAACGSAPGQPYSEAVLQLVVKGGLDMYTVQWIVRGPATRGPQKLDPAQWQERLRRLAPLRICRIVPDEQPPYPSCLNRT